MSMLTNAYPHKLLRKIKVANSNHQADSPFYVWPLVSDLVMCKLKEYDAIYMKPNYPTETRNHVNNINTPKLSLHSLRQLLSFVVES